MEAEVFPVDAQATHAKPRSLATLIAAVMPVSLKEPVGFIPWCLAKSRSILRAMAARVMWYRGVLPSRRLTALLKSSRMGSSSRKRQTPEQSNCSVEECRSRQTHLRAPPPWAAFADVALIL